MHSRTFIQWIELFLAVQTVALPLSYFAGSRLRNRLTVTMSRSSVKHTLHYMKF